MELIPSDQREVRNEVFIADWEKAPAKPPGLGTRPSPRVPAVIRGVTWKVRLSGQDANALKRLALELSDSLAAIPGRAGGSRMTCPTDSSSWCFVSVRWANRWSLSVEDVGRQLRGAF